VSTTILSTARSAKTVFLYCQVSLSSWSCLEKQALNDYYLNELDVTPLLAGIREMHCAIKLCTGLYIVCTLVTMIIIIILIVISIISLQGRSVVLVNFDRARAP